MYVDRGRAVTPRKPGPDDDVASGTLLPLEPALDAPSPDLAASAVDGPAIPALAPAEVGAPWSLPVLDHETAVAPVWLGGALRSGSAARVRAG